MAISKISLSFGKVNSKVDSQNLTSSKNSVRKIGPFQ